MSARRGSPKGLWCSLVLAGVLGLTPAGDAEGQVRRGLQSRAAFAALDSAQLSDSSQVRPLRPDGAQDSVLLDMLAFLEDSVGKAYGVEDTHIRRWDGFGSQAHPRFGILVDSLELAEVLAQVMNRKGAAGVPRDTAEARLVYVLRFLVAHEYAHLMQYRAFGQAFMEDPDSTRVIECGADLLGGLNFWVFTKSRYGDRPYPQVVLETVRDFGYIVGSSDWLDGTQHPLKEDRRVCIGSGIETASRLNSLAAVNHGATDSASLEAARSLRDSEPELANGTLGVMQWSRNRAHAIMAAGGGVVGGSRDLAVVRDSSVSRVVRILAEAAVSGPEALREQRAGPAPGAGSAFLLRSSLEPPWECTTSERNRTEEATCVSDMRFGSAERGPAFAGLVQRVEEGLAGTRWKRSTRVPPPPGPNDGVVVFMHGGKPDDLRHPQVTVALANTDRSPAVQLPPSYRLSVTVRSAATK